MVEGRQQGSFILFAAIFLQGLRRSLEAPNARADMARAGEAGTAGSRGNLGLKVRNVDCFGIKVGVFMEAAKRQKSRFAIEAVGPEPRGW